ncbi:AAA domain-containing protein [Spirosoma soli]|uniref:AAA domain-containing protein n=1 Tax=Spirosoma soli TaxID=1770529 RepID=A0ABW5M971_9BACT
MKIPVQPSVLKTFRRRLTNLSSRNRSLLLTSLPADQFIDLHETDFLLNRASFSVVADLIGRRPSVSLCEVLDARQERSNEVSRKLRRIDRTARFIEEERGTEDLYVGWPFVRGKFLDETVIHGPLLFFPVQIEQQGKFWKLNRRGDELAFLNPTLALAYGQFNQVKLPDEVIEKNVDDYDKDPLVFRTQLYEWLKESPLEINFNQDLFSDRLQLFNKLTAKDLGQLERTGELKLYPEAVLGIFPQAGSYLVPDYDALIERIAESDRLFTDDVAPDDFDFRSSPVTILERNLHTPLLMDASQEVAIRAVKAGQSLVVQGPPGTGKSQLIANLMADAAASGKRVLLVCQKRAALDVVQKRLEAVGMTPFVALIHDFQEDRRAVYNQIAKQIEQIDTYRQQNNSLNTVLLERDFDIESRQIDETVTYLQTFKDALFDTSVCGVSPKELYLTSNPNEPVIPLDDVYQQLHMATVDNFVRRLVDYAMYQQQLGPTHSWSDRVNFAPFSNSDLPKIDQTLVNWARTRTITNEQLTHLLGRPLSLNELADWQQHDWELTALLTLIDTPDVAALWRLIKHFRVNPAHPALSVSDAYYEHVASSWQTTLAAPGPELSLATDDVSSFNTLLNDALATRPSWIQWNWWQLTNPGKMQLQRVIAANGLTLSEGDLHILKNKIQKRIVLDTVEQKVKAILDDLPLTITPDSLELLRRAQHVMERINDSQPLRHLPDSLYQTPQQFRDAINVILARAKDLQEQQLVSQQYLTDSQVTCIWQDDRCVHELQQSLRRDFDLLVEADCLQEGFSVVERTVLERLLDRPPASWNELFLNSLRLTWLNHLERQHPELRSVSSLKMSQLEQALQTSVERKQMLSRDILLVKLREQTYRNLAYNRLNNVVTYRDLLHQTTKKRNVWPVRKLLEAFASELFKLVPCWLASPESVSALFPLQDDLFDLVIFDEASQCFAENGVPAIARGKQVVVTGDNQQLRPSDLYRTRLGEPEADDETPAALEAESLLELAAQYLPQVSLTEHYRSRSLDLITFSNQHFYGNRLSLLPHYDDINHHEPAIRYLNVKGTWQQNTNRAEAEAVLEILSQSATELPGRSVGIVTFNYPQQQLIQDMLDESFNSQEGPFYKLSVEEGLFVKNIENVQGDERDIIIFSIGYAPDERGRLAMQFGSLNAAGGGNRLNVAITRARERIYVITSLWPNELTVDNTANEGPKLLKAYLHYALDVAQERFVLRPRLNATLPSASLLKDKLRISHSNWQPELPFADLTVKDANSYRSLILTDDDSYYQQSTKQAHAYLPVSLRSRKWMFQRIWSREFWRKADIKK